MSSTRSRSTVRPLWPPPSPARFATWSHYRLRDHGDHTRPVDRQAADGSVGSPHARVGNCQASNKTKGSVERLGLSFYLLFVGERSPE